MRTLSCARQISSHCSRVTLADLKKKEKYEIQGSSFLCVLRIFVAILTKQIMLDADSKSFSLREGISSQSNLFTVKLIRKITPYCTSSNVSEVKIIYFTITRNIAQIFPKVQH